MSDLLTIYIDGACSGNPGPAAVGIVIWQEGKKIKEIYEEVEDLFNKHKDVEGLTYIYSNEYRGFVSNPLPSFWSSRVSKSYSDFKKD